MKLDVTFCVSILDTLYKYIPFSVKTETNVVDNYFNISSYLFCEYGIDHNYFRHFFNEYHAQIDNIHKIILNDELIEYIIFEIRKNHYHDIRVGNFNYVNEIIDEMVIDSIKNQHMKLVREFYEMILEHESFLSYNYIIENLTKFNTTSILPNDTGKIDMGKGLVIYFPNGSLDFKE